LNNTNTKFSKKTDGRKHFDPLVPTLEEAMALRREVIGLRAELAEANYQRAKAEVDASNTMRQLERTLSSNSWRIGRVITSPVRLVKFVIKSIRRCECP
jgi:hypothetical protein